MMSVERNGRVLEGASKHPVYESEVVQRAAHQEGLLLDFQPENFRRVEVSRWNFFKQTERL